MIPLSIDAVEVIRARLRDIIAAKSLTGRQLTVASAKSGGVYLDLRKTMLDPEGANLIADLMLDVLAKEDVDHVGGVALGAGPLIASLCVKSYHRRLRLRYFYLRNDAKSNGTDGLLDGEIEKGAKVAILEDITTSGASALKVAAAIRARGGRAKLVLTVVDRGDGAEAAFKAHGLRLVPLLNWRDFAPNQKRRGV